MSVLYHKMYITHDYYNKRKYVGFFAASYIHMLCDLENYLYRTRCLALIDKFAEALGTSCELSPDMLNFPLSQVRENLRAGSRQKIRNSLTEAAMLEIRNILPRGKEGTQRRMGRAPRASYGEQLVQSHEGWGIQINYNQPGTSLFKASLWKHPAPAIAPLK